MITIVGLVLFSLLTILQTTIVNRMLLLNGSADLVLLFILAWSLQDRVESAWLWCVIGGVLVTMYTSLPLGTFLVAYLASTGIARLLKRRVWKAPFLAMLAATFTGTIIVLGISFAARWLTGANLPIVRSLNIIVLPSLLLNLALAIPVFSITRDIAGWLYPEELEV